jgi:uncharacterized protein (DUF488 family)
MLSEVIRVDPRTISALASMTISAIGHSIHPIEPFPEMLTAHSITLAADVRTLPGARHHPQFNKEALSASLRERGIACHHLPGLGGPRRPKKGSVNTGWSSAGFRGYADHLQTEGFAAALAELVAPAKERPAAILCAEAVPWRCHRSLIADAPTVRGTRVLHIVSAVLAREHALTPFARVNGTTITYPGQ